MRAAVPPSQASVVPTDLNVMTRTKVTKLDVTTRASEQGDVGHALLPRKSIFQQGTVGEANTLDDARVVERDGVLQHKAMADQQVKLVWTLHRHDACLDADRRLSGKLQHNVSRPSSVHASTIHSRDAELSSRVDDDAVLGSKLRLYEYPRVGII
jgi:hypothetical protein